MRTGFNQKLLHVKIADNEERGRYPQGPQVVVTTQNVYHRKKEASADKQRVLRKRNTSRDIVLNQRITIDANAETLKPLDAEPEKPNAIDDKQHPDRVQQVVHQALQNQEVSLRQLFFLEYKKNFPDGQTNPIVYSKFGKKNYNSDESYDPNNPQTLIRTCDIKKLLKNQNFEPPKESFKQTEQAPKPEESYYRVTDQNDKTLVFESRFESGNLQLVHKRSDAEYDLVLQNDINSQGHTQWFYFRVQNVSKG